MNDLMADGIAQTSQWLPVIGVACIGFALISIAFGTQPQNLRFWWRRTEPMSIVLLNNASPIPSELAMNDEKTINQNEYLIGLGLFTLMQRSWQRHEEAQATLFELLKKDDVTDGGWAFQSVIEKESFDDLLKHYGLTVKVKKKKED